MIKVFINGMGRIGRAILRNIITNSITESGSLKIVGFNDIGMDVYQLAYLLKYDSTGQGLKNHTVEVIDSDTLAIDGTKITLYHLQDIANLPLGELSGDVVFECTGRLTQSEQLQRFIYAGAKKVILCCPPSTGDIPILVYGVNQKDVDYINENIISIGSCSNQAIASLLHPINMNYTISSCIAKVIRSYTNDQSLMDNASKNYERGRAASQNIVPSSVSGAGRIIASILSFLDDKVVAQAFRTPTILGGAVDLTITIDKVPTKDEIDVCLIDSYAKLHNHIDYSSENLVTSDVIGSHTAVTYLSTYTQIVGNTINIVGLYDNENGFACQAIRTAWLIV